MYFSEKLIYLPLTVLKWKQAVSPEDETLTDIRMSANNLDLDILPDQIDDLQVAILRDKYDMWVEELEAMLSGEHEFMIEDDIMV